MMTMRWTAAVRAARRRRKARKAVMMMMMRAIVVHGLEGPRVKLATRPQTCTACRP